MKQEHRMGDRKTIPSILFGLGLILIAIGLGISLIQKAPEDLLTEQESVENCVYPAPVSFSAPKLTLQTLDLEPIDLEQYQGTTVLLNAWATWCPPCLAELPDLETFYRQHRHENFVLIGVNIGESANTVQEFIQDYPLSFPVWLDPEEKTLRALNTIALPYSILVDRNGEVQMAWSGATCIENLEAAVTPILRQ
jgi:peroxiredoxin